jgi:hypothetical protein
LKWRQQYCNNQKAASQTRLHLGVLDDEGCCGLGGLQLVKQLKKGRRVGQPNALKENATWAPSEEQSFVHQGMGLES